MRYPNEPVLAYDLGTKPEVLDALLERNLGQIQQLRNVVLLPRPHLVQHPLRVRHLLEPMGVPFRVAVHVVALAPKHDQMIPHGGIQIGRHNRV